MVKRKIENYKKESFELDESKKIVQGLRDITGKSIKLPRYISFYYTNENVLNLYIQEQCCTNGDIMNATCENMQTDNAAFEGWSICLKAWLRDIDKIILKWDAPKSGNAHYNRFLYRVFMFREAFKWFEIDKSNQDEVKSFSCNLNDLKNNIHGKDPELKKRKDNQLGETEMEYIMANGLGKEMCFHYNIDFIDRQLAVGVKKNNKEFFTGRGAAIDLWGLNTKDKTLKIIELKYNSEKSRKQKNKKVGIISELFFYSCVMRDIINGRIAVPSKCVRIHEEKFYNMCTSLELIHADMLSNLYHPLLENKLVMDILNSGNFKDVIYSKTKYSFNIAKNILCFDKKC